MSINLSQPDDHAHHRKHLNISPQEYIVEDEFKDSSLSNSPEFSKQNKKAKATEYRKKYDQEVQRDQGVFKNTFWTQSKALLEKNLALQSKQKGTNICQVRNCWFPVQKE